MNLQRVARRLLTAAGAGALVLAVAWIAWWLHARLLVREVQAEIAASGLPTTADKILPADVPEADNAAPLLKKAAVLLGEVKKREGYIDACPGASSPERAPELFDAERLSALRAQMALPEVREILDLLHEAAARPVAVFDRNYLRGPSMDVSPLTSLLEGARLLGTAAWLSAKNGDAPAAAASLVTVSRLAAFGLSDPVLIGWLVGLSVDNLAVSMTAAVLAALPERSFPTGNWSRLEGEWERHRKTARAGLQRVIDGERILAGGWVYDNVLRANGSLSELYAAINSASGDDRWVRFSLWAYQYPLRPLLIADQAAYLRFMLGLRRAAEAPVGQDGTPQSLAEIPGTALFTRLIAPGLEAVLARTDENIVLLQLGQIGLALEDCRARQGSYPATLEEVGMPAAMVGDPFRGRPLVYRPSNQGVLLYSVGRERGDDGGAYRKDLAWRVGRNAP